MKERIKLGSNRYRLVVLHVTERDLHARPLKVEVVHDDRRVKVYDGMEFITAYIPEAETRKVKPS